MNKTFVYVLGCPSILLSNDDYASFIKTIAMLEDNGKLCIKHRFSEANQRKINRELKKHSGSLGDTQSILVRYTQEGDWVNFLHFNADSQARVIKDNFVSDSGMYLFIKYDDESKIPKHIVDTTKQRLTAYIKSKSDDVSVIEKVKNNCMQLLLSVKGRIFAVSKTADELYPKH